MADGITIAFEPLGRVGQGDLVVFVGDDLTLSGTVAEAIGQAAGDLVTRAAASERFKGKSLSALSLPAPAGLDAEWDSLWASLTFDVPAAHGAAMPQHDRPTCFQSQRVDR